ncbi:MAG TPA: hypothetical protein VF449_00405 [Parvibaculum sp.]
MRIMAFVAALTLSAGGIAHAAAVAPAAPTPDPTMIDLTGSIVTANLTGGVADPVPIFIGSSGPVIFVFGMPGIGEAGTDVSLRRPGMSFGPMAGVRQPRRH